MNKFTPTDWSLDVTTLGARVYGDDDIAQCINIILLTVKGSDPLRPTFGANILQWIDAPVNEAGPQMVKSVIDGIKAWEPRVVVTNVTYRVEDSNLVFSVYWKRKDSTKQNNKTEVVYAR